MSGYDDGPRKGFSLDNYKTVPERMAEAFAKYPQASLQSEVITLPSAFADKYVAVKARFFRTPDDAAPGEGLAWELVPGKTPYTKDSELMNAETSAWGRAIVAAFAADTQKGIASREEVQARQAPKPKARQNPTTSPTIVQDAPNGEGEIDLEAKQWEAKQKLRLLEGLGGDKDKAKAEWEVIASTWNMANRAEIEDVIGSVLVANMPPEQAPFL